MLTLATVDTGSFQWTALSMTRHGCNVALQAAYDRHCESEFRWAESALMDDLIAAGEVNYATISLGEALRDGSRVQ